MSTYFLDRLLPEEKNAIPYFETIGSFVDYIAGQYENAPALTQDERVITYASLKQHIEAKRTVLAENNLKKGDCVALMDLNTPDCIEWFLAVSSFGCIAVMLPASMTPESMSGVEKLFELRLFVYGAPFEAQAKAVSVPSVPTGETGKGCTPAGDVQKQDAAAIFFTGGTTGKPKGTILSHGALMRGAQNGTYRSTSVFGQSFIAALPFTHVFGMVFSLLSPLYTGSCVEVLSNMRDLFAKMPVVKPTTMIAVPGLAELMLGVAKMRGVEALGGHLKTIICGAAPVPPRLYHGFLPMGVEVMSGYGMTETANLISGNLDMATHPASVGCQYPYQEMKIVNGELWVRGDMLFSGYWKDEEATRAAMEDGWLKTGDLVKVDEDGFITIVGRCKNLILLPNGENVSPEEVESAYYTCALVQDCLAKEGLVQGNPVIELEVFPAEGVSEDALLTALRPITDSLPTFMRPSKITLRTEPFPRNAAMKIIRNP